MDARKAQLIQDGFKTFSEAHEIESSLGYFVDNDGTTVFAFNEIVDQHVMHLVATLVLKMAEHNQADPQVFVKAFGEIIDEHVNAK